MSRFASSAVRLICFPHAGGSARSYLPWKRQVPSDVEVITVPLPSRHYPPGRPDPADFAELSRAAMQDVAQLSEGVPYALFGHSMGALLAYEVACLLEATTAHLPTALFVSGCKPPQHWEQRPKRVSWSDAAILAEVAELGGTPLELIHHPEMREILLPLLRHDYAMIDTYVYRRMAPLRSPMGILGGLLDSNVPHELLTDWLKLTHGRARVQTFAGGHFFIQSALQDVLRFIVAFLKAERNYT